MGCVPGRIDGSGGQHFEDVAIRVLEIEAAAAMPVVDLHVGARAWAAAIGNALVLDPGEDRVELGFADLEGVVVVLEIAALVEIEGQLLVDLDRREVGMRPLVFEPEDPREEAGRGDLVAGRDDGVIENDSHGPPPADRQEMGANATPENSAVSPPAQSAIGAPTPGWLSAAPAPASRSAAAARARAPSEAAPQAHW